MESPPSIRLGDPVFVKVGGQHGMLRAWPGKLHAKLRIGKQLFYKVILYGKRGRMAVKPQFVVPYAQHETELKSFSKGIEKLQALRLKAGHRDQMRTCIKKKTKIRCLKPTRAQRGGIQPATTAATQKQLFVRLQHKSHIDQLALPPTLPLTFSTPDTAPPLTSNLATSSHSSSELPECQPPKVPTPEVVPKRKSRRQRNIETSNKSHSLEMFQPSNLPIPELSSECNYMKTSSSVIPRSEVASIRKSERLRSSAPCKCGCSLKIKPSKISLASNTETAFKTVQHHGHTVPGDSVSRFKAIKTPRVTSSKSIPKKKKKYDYHGPEEPFGCLSDESSLDDVLVSCKPSVALTTESVTSSKSAPAINSTYGINIEIASNAPATEAAARSTNSVIKDKAQISTKAHLGATPNNKKLITAALSVIPISTSHITPSAPENIMDDLNAISEGLFTLDDATMKETGRRSVRLQKRISAQCKAEEKQKKGLISVSPEKCSGLKAKICNKKIKSTSMSDTKTSETTTESQQPDPRLSPFLNVVLSTSQHDGEKSTSSQGLKKKWASLESLHTPEDLTLESGFSTETSSRTCGEGCSAAAFSALTSWQKVPGTIFSIYQALKRDVQIERALRKLYAALEINRPLPDLDGALAEVAKIKKLVTGPLMLLKNPPLVIATIKLIWYRPTQQQMRNFGKDKDIQMSQASVLRQKAAELHQHMQCFFHVPEGRVFSVWFAEIISELWLLFPTDNKVLSIVDNIILDASSDDDEEEEVLKPGGSRNSSCSSSRCSSSSDCRSSSRCSSSSGCRSSSRCSSSSSVSSGEAD